MIDAHRVVFNGMDSLDFDITPHLSFDGDNGDSASFLNRDSVYSEHYDGSFRRIHSYKYNEVLSPTFTFLKQDFSDFDEFENRTILSWLTASNKPGWIEVYKDDSNVLSYKLFGNFTSVEVYKLGSGRVVGYTATFESSAPYAYSREFIYPEVYETTEELSSNDENNDYLDVNGVKSFTITCNTDEYNKLIYPKVIVNFNRENIYFPVNAKPTDDEYMIPNVIYTYPDGSTSKYYISISTEDTLLRTNVVTVSGNTNPSLDLLVENPSNYFYVKNGREHTIKQIVDNQGTYEWKTIVKIGAAVKIDTTYMSNGTPMSKEIIVKGAALDEEITLDGTNKVISVIPDDGVRIMGDDFNWEWLPLAYGDNNITIAGNCVVQIRWIEPRKVGSL